MRKVEIGNATLIHGDCFEVLPTLSGFQSIVTDPPFGMAFHSERRMKSTQHKMILNDDNTDLLEWICRVEVLHSKYIFCRWDNLYQVKKPNSVITWVKNNHSMGDLKHEHARQTELVLFYRGGEHFFPGKRPNDVIKAPRTQNDLHPTQKPTGLMRAILEWTHGTILDPFMGSASTGVAAFQMGKAFIGIEKDEEYFEIAVKRIRDAHKQPDMFLEAK